jgi:hypothetical protein
VSKYKIQEKIEVNSNGTHPQEVAQLAGTTPNEAGVTSSNPPLPLLCEHVKIIIIIIIKSNGTHILYHKREHMLLFFTY